MSKITFRADDDLVQRLEAMDASKSEVMREALRAYLDGDDGSQGDLEAVVHDRVDELVAERLDALDVGGAGDRGSSGGAQDVNVSITLDGVATDAAAGVEASTAEPGRPESAESQESDADGSPAEEATTTCAQCGEPLDGDHVHCPNCGEKATHRVFCECGDELRSDWAFCPTCGRRTPAADVLEGR